MALDALAEQTHMLTLDSANVDESNDVQVAEIASKESETSYLQIESLPSKGRAFVAARDIPQGTLVHVGAPFASVVHQSWMPETCHGCYAFSYPKSMKIKAIAADDDAHRWRKWWQAEMHKEKRSKKAKAPALSKLQLKHVAFCSDTCKQAHIRRFAGTKDEHGVPIAWYKWLTCLYRLEHADDATMDEKDENDAVETRSTREFDVEDDDDLRAFLDGAWVSWTGSQRRDAVMFAEDDEADDANDATMLRLMTFCLLQCQTTTRDALLTMQDNELAAFRSQYKGPRFVSQIDIHGPSAFATFMPSATRHAMILYKRLAHALTTATTEAPKPLADEWVLDQRLFRAIYYREMANGFGLWEQPAASSIFDDIITDDLELLGYGIYPSAVYFNHACDANISKVRRGREMLFYAKHDIAKGTEACISYGNVDAPVHDRRTRLLDHYHFWCACSRCIQEEEPAPCHL
ncbi:hypothetical protein BC940DRAFT_287073 [Gongronella butleri]|nr:hypothetical protein BC940DRAFT_287073 [Gongronella butleri]